MAEVNSPRIKDRFSTKEEFERVLELASDVASYGFETEFVGNLKEKYEQYGMNAFFSEKQEDVLDGIAYRKD